MKKLFIIAFLICCSASLAQAIENRSITIDDKGRIFLATLDKKVLVYAESKDGGITFSSPATLAAFSVTPESFSNLFINDDHYAVFRSGKDIYFLKDRVNSPNPAKAQKIEPRMEFPDKDASPALAVRDHKIALAFERLDPKGKKVIYYQESDDNGLSWSRFTTIVSTDESLQTPKLTIDKLYRTYLIALAKDRSERQNIIYSFTKEDKEVDFSPAVKIQQDDQNLDSLKIRSIKDTWVLVTWKAGFLDQPALYYSYAIDGGKHFSTPKTFADSQSFIEVYPYEKKLKALVLEKGTGLPKAIDLEIDLLDKVELISPAKGVALNTLYPNLTFESLNQPPLRYTVELSPDQNFAANNTFIFETIDNGGLDKVSYHLPIELSGKKYFWRVKADNALSESLYSEISYFEIDNDLPKVLSKTLDEKTIYQSGILTFEAAFSKPMDALSVLSSSTEGISLSSYNWISPQKAKFEMLIVPSLANGQYSLNIAGLKDKAGNTAGVIGRIKVDNSAPKITIINPDPLKWMKADALVVIEAKVFDPQNDVADESEAIITIKGQTFKLSYDKSEQSLSGFITLPENLESGIHPAEIQLLDQKGNIGTLVFDLKIDATPPQASAKSSIFSSEKQRIKFDITDAGAGIDTAGTLIKVSDAYGTTIEGFASIEADCLLFVSTQLMSEGSYEVKVVARDLIGNIAAPKAFKIEIDTTCPTLTLTSSLPAETREGSIVISGQAFDKNLSQVSLSLNNEQPQTLLLNEKNIFTKKIDLKSDVNRFEIRALDRAGNAGLETIEIYAYLSGQASAATATLANAPNPFDPRTESTVIQYNLDQDCEVKIFIFDMLGNLIWQTNLGTTRNGSTSWDGKTRFGSTVDNGIYPYCLVAKDLNGKTAVTRGKIIALK